MPLHSYTVFLIEGLTHCKESEKEWPYREIFRFIHTHTFTSPLLGLFKHTQAIMWVSYLKSPDGFPWFLEYRTNSSLAPKAPSHLNAAASLWSSLLGIMVLHSLFQPDWNPMNFLLGTTLSLVSFLWYLRLCCVLPFTSACHLLRPSWTSRLGKCPSVLLCNCWPGCNTPYSLR